MLTRKQQRVARAEAQLALGRNLRAYHGRTLAWAVATDAANHHARTHGRVAWTVEDYNVAVVKFNELYPEGEL